MVDYKKDKISKVKSEVNELHPLLEKLLRKIPGVIDVEYSHGNTEMGADFLISRENELFKKIDYIGVIAKVGKIVQDYSGIERQIKECALPKYVHGGKSKIKIEEIWIINTDTISHNAQEKINHDYSDRKVQFIDSDHLIDWIDMYFPPYWNDISIEVSDYLLKLNTKTLDIDNNLSLFNIPNNNFYIEQDIYLSPERKYKQNSLKSSKPKLVNIYEEIRDHKIILLEGGAGSGKSKLIRRLIIHFSEPNNFVKEKIIPVFTTCKDIIENYKGDINKLLEDQIDEKLRSQIEDSEFLVLIDGIDEKDIEPEKQIENLAVLINSLNMRENVKAIITSRYLSGLEKEGDVENRLTRYELPQLSLKKTIEFLTILCKNLNIKNRIIEDIKKSQLLREMPRSPIAAILLAKLLNENSTDLPSNLTELYQKYTELLLGRWDIEKGIETNKNYQTIENIMIQFSLNILDFQMSSITIVDAEQIIEEYLSKRNLGIKTADILEKIIYRCDLISYDKGQKSISFKHRTFCEFFYAKNYSREIYPDISNRAFHFYWMNTIFFYLGLQKDSPKVLKEILSIEPRSEFERWLKVINMGNYLLASYASPYSIITEGLSSIFTEASNLYTEISKGVIVSPFSVFSQMDLLCLMQYLIRESYSFDFFKLALEESVLNIDYSELSNDQKAYAMFFINMAYIDIDPKYNFEKILEKYIIGMPMDLSLAVLHEIKKVDDKSTVIKKYEKKLRRAAEKDKSLQAKINILYKVPIKKLFK